MLHLGKLGAKLTQMDQAPSRTYIGCPSRGPFKPDHYRY